MSDCKPECHSCCETVHIPILHLILPHLHMNEKGHELFKAHGFEELLKTNGEIEIKHRCDQLDESNKCRIYESRPQICRDFNCKGN